jgi:hypothetical protein
VDVIVARFRGGPCDGYELAMMGGLPSYLMLMPSPVSDHRAREAMPWVIVGAGFDDHWPDQQRYELAEETLLEVGGGYVPGAIYAHAEDGRPDG